jgi:hypothetical protein
MLLFNVAWFIVGGILFFETTYPACPLGRPVTDIGMTVFVLQAIGVGIPCLLRLCGAAF